MPFFIKKNIRKLRSADSPVVLSFISFLSTYLKVDKDDIHKKEFRIMILKIIKDLRERMEARIKMMQERLTKT